MLFRLISSSFYGEWRSNLPLISDRCSVIDMKKRGSSFSECITIWRFTVRLYPENSGRETNPEWNESSSWLTVRLLFLFRTILSWTSWDPKNVHCNRVLAYDSCPYFTLPENVSLSAGFLLPENVSLSAVHCPAVFSALTKLQSGKTFTIQVVHAYESSPGWKKRSPYK